MLVRTATKSRVDAMVEVGRVVAGGAQGNLVAGLFEKPRIDSLDANVLVPELTADMVKRRHRWQRSGGSMLGEGG